jgi:hypothetical protein
MLAEGSAMKQTDLSPLRDEIAELVQQSPLGRRVRNVAVEPSEDDDGTGEFLRVIVELKDLETTAFEDVDGLISAIEEAVAKRDERYPSVRFADAA